MLVIGGYNSSNTANLARICAASRPTFHIADPDCLVSAERDPPPAGRRARPKRRPADWLPAAGQCVDRPHLGRVDARQSRGRHRHPQARRDFCGVGPARKSLSPAKRTPKYNLSRRRIPLSNSPFSYFRGFTHESGLVARPRRRPVAAGMAPPVGAQSFAWWKSEEFQKEVGLTPEQCTPHRQRLSDHAAEAAAGQRRAGQTGSRAVADDRGSTPTRARVVTQIDRVEAMRATLNKIRTLMLLHDAAGADTRATGRSSTPRTTSG